MNFLAHALLAGTDDADRLGGILGDYIKGPLPGTLPADLARGVALHRQIDVFADRHPAFLRSRARVSAARRRYSGVMADMFYDHFLARHWEHFHAQPLLDFTAGVYALLRRHEATLPPRLASMVPTMEKDDWLASYADSAVIGHALNRMAHRLRQPNGLSGAGDELLDHYEGFEADFFAFLPDALAFARPQWAASMGRSDGDPGSPLVSVL